MKRSTLWTWIAAAAFGVGLAGTASADPWDRDHESGHMRMQELRQNMASKDAVARPSTEHGVTGHQIGRDTVERDGWKQNFKDRNEMLSHMSEQTKQRASRTAAARGDDNESASDRSYPNAGHSVSRPAEVTAKAARGVKSTPVSSEAADPMTQKEQQITSTSAAGHQLGQDTIHMGGQYKSFKNRADMMSHLNTATSMRASHTGESNAMDEGTGSVAFPNAGSHTSNPAQLSDGARKGLAALGFAAAGKKQSSADIEDKAR